MNQRSLRHITNQRVSKEELPRLLGELRDMHDRAAAIVAATLVEDALEDLMVSRMVRLSNDEHAHLFRGEGPLSTFSAKIRIGRAFKSIDSDSFNDLNAIKNIRNVFAHARISVGFTTPEIVDHVNRISIINTYSDPLFEEINSVFYHIMKNITSDTPRAKYLHSCILYIFMLRLFSTDPDDIEDEQ